MTKKILASILDLAGVDNKILLASIKIIIKRTHELLANRWPLSIQ